MIETPAAWQALADARPDLAANFRTERNRLQALVEDMYGEHSNRDLDFIQVDAEGRFAGAWRLDIDEAGDPVILAIDAEWEGDDTPEARAELAAAVIGIAVRHNYGHFRGRRGGGAAFPPYWA